MSECPENCPYLPRIEALEKESQHNKDAHKEFYGKLEESHTNVARFFRGILSRYIAMYPSLTIASNKPSFTNDDFLRGKLYLASQRIVKRWHARCPRWDMVLNQLQLIFADRAVG